MINAVPNNDCVRFIKPDRDFFAQQGNLSRVQCNNHGRTFFVLNTFECLKEKNGLWVKANHNLL